MPFATISFLFLRPGAPSRVLAPFQKVATLGELRILFLVNNRNVNASVLELIGSVFNVWFSIYVLLCPLFSLPLYLFKVLFINGAFCSLDLPSFLLSVFSFVSVGLSSCYLFNEKNKTASCVILLSLDPFCCLCLKTVLQLVFLFTSFKDLVSCVRSFVTCVCLLFFLWNHQSFMASMWKYSSSGFCSVFHKYSCI